ncbi:MAG: hypothetical protein KJ944_08495 [Alphaproteobacteria bacterium]|nr:hypothetical protein [Alphaproteobacteria bacterium]MBU1561508.1 hypothetical protein [Alphaproteobacteria bacterium]MBU2302621.1 hypothetical protein [Alphaproteobacteria bacterium]MBU2368304.1 hypothetical protein [Alphaproteobacteria bacterium]
MVEKIKCLEAKYASAQELIADTVASANRLAERARIAEAQVAKLEAELAKANGSCSEMVLKLNDVNQRNTAMQDKLAATLANADRLGTNLATEQATVRRGDERIVELTKEVNSQRSRLDEASLWIRDEKSNTVLREQTIAALQSELSALRSRGLFARLFNR